MHKSVCVCEPVPVCSSACVSIGAVAHKFFLLVLAVTIMCSCVSEVKRICSEHLLQHYPVCRCGGPPPPPPPQHTYGYTVYSLVYSFIKLVLVHFPHQHIFYITNSWPSQVSSAGIACGVAIFIDFSECHTVTE